MSVVTKSVEVDVPVRIAYDQWTQFEDFPRFMEGVEEVQQLDDATLRWHVNIGGVDREFVTRIEDQVPDQRIAWRAIEGEDQSGTVTFEPIDGDRTRVNLEMTYESERWTDRVADFLNVIDARTEKDLERFKSFIEESGGRPTGAWRGEVDHGQVTDPDADAREPGLSTRSGPDAAPEVGGESSSDLGGPGHLGGGPAGEPPRRA